MEFSQLHILTDEQLVKMAQEGSETAQEILLEKYKGFVKKKTKDYYIAGGDGEDLVQEGMIGLFKAIQNYDENRDASFRTFAELCVNNQISSAIKKANRLKHQPLNESISFSKEVEGDGMDTTLGDMIQASSQHEPEELVLMREIVKVLKNSDGDMFSELEWQVWNETLKGKSYQEIAEHLDRSPKSIDNALQRIKKKIIAYLQS